MWSLNAVVGKCVNTDSARKGETARVVDANYEARGARVESGGEADLNNPESSRFCLVQRTGCGRHSAAVRTFATMSSGSGQTAGVPEGIGKGGRDAMGVVPLNWTAPTTKKVSLSQKNTPGVNGSIKSAVM